MSPRAANSRRPSFRRPSGRRGAVLIVALLVAALIAVVLASYLNLSLSSTRLSKRTFDGYAALNLAEAGAEEAVWSFNRSVRGETDAWTGWSNNSTSAWQKFSNFNFGGNTSGWVKVYVDNYNPPQNARPKIITQSSIGAPGDTATTKMLEVTLRRRSRFANGLVARDNVTFSGANASVDSWNSDPDGDAATDAVAYNPSIRTDRGSVGSMGILNAAVMLNQASVWGYVATGGAQPQVGNNGTIRGADTPANVPIDPRRISTDFNADFDPVVAPVDGTPILTVPAVLGTLGTRTKWRAPGIVLNGTETLLIQGDVTLVLTSGSAADAISVAGNASIIVPEGSKFTVYAEGKVTVAGRGLFNGNAQPISIQLWGTNTSAAGQQIDVVGNGALKAVIYAPNGDVKINGNGDVMGSVVARNITLVGNAAFHYDESLTQRDSNEPFGIDKWRELTTETDRARYSPLFSGW
ncbi:MAG TPA: pilus assembly PilX N-terminal domain-containing protein [Opitutaceae bacterium]|nr:pilus assembly PilX N-terminal domain-containing protein [Opitutaceae bacterium]